MEIAIVTGNRPAIEQRLRIGDSPQDLNHLGIPVLYDALRQNVPGLLDLLTEAGADWSVPYNQGGFTPLIYASLHCQKQTVEWLVGHGEDVNQSTTKGVAAIHVAAQRQDPAIARYLYEQGANPFAETAHGESPLLLSLKAKEGLATFEFLLQCYADHRRSLAPRLLECLSCIFERQQHNAIDAATRLLRHADHVPTEQALRDYMGMPGHYASTPFRSLERTLSSRLSSTLFALLKAERISRACQSERDSSRAWSGHQGL